MNFLDDATRKQLEAEGLARAQRHRGGDQRNELRLDYPPVKVVGGPHDGQQVFQPCEVVEIELSAADGQRHTYRRKAVGRTAADDVYEHVPLTQVQQEKAEALEAQIAELRKQQAALKAQKKGA